MKQRTTISFQCPPELKKRIEEEAKKDRRNTSQWLIKWLEDSLAGSTQTTTTPMIVGLDQPNGDQNDVAK